MSSLATFTLQREFGYVGLVGVASSFVLLYLGAKVGQARKKYEVPYPIMYDNAKPQFNCVQRGHQNALESYPFYLLFLVLGGLKHPLVSASCGAAWLVGRILYAQGYASGDPKKRGPGGAVGYISMLGLMGSTISFCLSTLGYL